jgi:uncharacterized membrane protein
MWVYPIAYLASLAAFLLADAVWLGLMAGRVYKPAMGSLVLDNFAIAPAIAFYALYGVGLVVFAVLPSYGADKPYQALLLGALFGLVAYGTYDLTNLATLRNWPLSVTILDMAWGTVASAIAGFAGFHAIALLIGRQSG